MVPAVKEGDSLIQRQKEHTLGRAKERESEREKRRERDQDGMCRMPEKLSSHLPTAGICKL
jgi:hypothetical protein